LAAGVARAGGDGRDAGGAGELGRGGEALSAGDLADELGRDERAELGLGEQLRRDPSDELGDVALESRDGVGEVAQAAQLVARDPDAHRLLGAGEASRDPGAPPLRKQCAAGELRFGPEVVQMPLQRVVELDAVTDEALAVIDQQPRIELGAVELRGGKRLEGPSRSAARATLTASMPSDFPRARELLRVSAIRLVEMRRTRSPRSIKKRSNAPETCRQSSSAQKRSPSRPRAHASSAENPARPT
jgi:hypothetical protein